MVIRRANSNDIGDINKLLYQVADVHARLRPDIFKKGAKKYSDGEIFAILNDYSRPVFIAKGDDGNISGYAFCIIERKGGGILNGIKTLYIDDLCVDEAARRQGVGKALLNHVLSFAKAESCYNVTLNVWADNRDALAFYESLGLTPRQFVMEKIIK